jgi:SAM-dependent methyltransferase
MLLGGQRQPAPAEPAAAAPAMPEDVHAVKVTTPVQAAAVADPELAKDQEDYLQDVMAFTHLGHDEALAKIQAGTGLIAAEWKEWESKGPMGPDRSLAFYKQTPNYVYDLGRWHLWDATKRGWDLKVVQAISEYHPKTVLDFGCGAGNNSLMLAKAGYEVTLADVDGQTLAFAISRFERHHLPYKVWKTDTEPAPPLPKYDLILAFDVLEHLPKPVLRTTVDQLNKLKDEKTHLWVEAPFGKNDVHPMHENADPETLALIQKLNPD